jgi:hypothetical protein
MRITRNQLTDLINEEISSALLERQNRRLLEDAMDPAEFDSISMDDLLDFAKEYASLPDDMRRNLDLILDGRGESVTAEEVEELQVRLGGHNNELDQYLEEAHKTAQTDDDDDDDGTYAAAYRANR